MKLAIIRLLAEDISLYQSIVGGDIRVASTINDLFVIDLFQRKY